MRRMYENWTKEALIKKILELEKPLQTHSQAHTVARTAKKQKQMDFSKYSTRTVAIKLAYLGWNYYGLAYQKDSSLPTVEGHVLEAFYKTKCIASMDPTECDFARCGRTDRDVSAMEQVINLRLRSNLSPGQQQDAAMDPQELDYLKILNSHLPADILAYEICLRPPAGFNARFSCKYRHYRYYFDSSNLDVEKMDEAARLFLGEQDFRNFCKIDASKQITNYNRTILESRIIQENGICYLSLRGTAFLWNQVRSIMAILFLIGQNLETKELVSTLLDISKSPQRPAYEIASGIPLVLYGCGYDPMEWQNSPYTSKDNLFNVWHDYWIKQTMANTMLHVVLPHVGNDARPVSANVGAGVGRRSKYVPVVRRPKNSTFEQVNAKWRDKRDAKREAKRATSQTEPDN